MQPTNQQTSNHANNEASKQRRNQDICHSLYKHIVCFSSTWPVAKPSTILFVFVAFTGPPPVPFPDNWRGKAIARPKKLCDSMATKSPINLLFDFQVIAMQTEKRPVSTHQNNCKILTKAKQSNTK